MGDGYHVCIMPPLRLVCNSFRSVLALTVCSIPFPLPLDHQRYFPGLSCNLVPKHGLILWHFKDSLPSRTRKGEVCLIFIADILISQI